ncbi:MAG: rubrerythrin family protein [Omnitrophica WOR_2 bacterium]|jgi:rubrerythrin
MKKLIFLIIVSTVMSFSCTKINPAKTISDLNAAFIGESTASAKYAAFAVEARNEGFNKIAKLFEAASKSESIHAANHLKVLEGLNQKVAEFKPEFKVDSINANLKAAVEGETYEVTTMYPGFIADAKTEKVNKAVKSFNWAMDTEKKHQKLYSESIMALTSGLENTMPVNYAVCPVCGNTYDAAKPDAKCAICQTDKKEFIII